MSAFRCLPIATQTARRFRDTGYDDRGHSLHRRIATAPGSPCRHCLRLASKGDAMLLGSYDLPLPLGVYWTPSPIFIHEADCRRFEAANEMPETVRRNPLVSLRSYDAEGMCLYDLGHVCDGREADVPLQAALDDPRTAYVNIHTAKPGCWLCRVERA